MDQKLYVYEDANLNKQIKALLKGGDNPACAARHARSIIEEFINAGFLNLKNAGRLTRHGEARIRNSLKFDLVGGYRLVAVLVQSGIAFVYAGSHAECDHWINNNAWIEPDLDKKRNRITQICERECVEGEEANTHGDQFQPDYDVPFLQEITQQDLRLIFSGLCRK